MPPSPHTAWLARLNAALADLGQKHLLRELRILQGPQGPAISLQNQTYIQFSSNNYLGLANDPEVAAAAVDATARFGTGAGASRLVAGSMALHEELELALAAFKHTEAALVFPTGFMANLAVLTTFASSHDGIVSDKLNHASLLDAAKYSGAYHRTFPHRRYERAGALLEACKEKAPAPTDIHGVHDRTINHPLRFLVTDSVFSMDGDLADLPAACDVAQAAGALVIVDEAHGTGVLGAHGRGLAELQNVEERIALTIGTLSKALGSVGGFVAGPKAAIDTLINHARSFIYTTALPPATSAAALAALKIVAREPQRRRRVMHLAAHVRQSLVTMGFDCGDSASPIIPVILGSAQSALAAAAFLRDRGIWVPAIRPPTVAPNSARLRLSLMATHTDAHVEQLLAAMRALRALPDITHAV
jgi:8-amino-7-oxononanoate synthase